MSNSTVNGESRSSLPNGESRSSLPNGESRSSLPIGESRSSLPIGESDEKITNKIKLYRNNMKLSIQKIKEKLKDDGLDISIYKINKLLK
jgi:hypothetical protein